jgi:hypothetical protein
VEAPQSVPRYAGTPREVGRAIGRSLGAGLEANIARYIRERPRRAGALDRDELARGALPWLNALPDRFREELEGLAEGANVPLQRVAEWNYVEYCVDDGCGALLGLIDGHAWVARNNDMFVPGVWGHAVVREIAGRIPTLCFGQEGDVFTATGVNRERLWLHHQALTVSDAPRPGRPRMPSWVLLTDMLETCATIAQVEARLEEVDRDDGMLLFAVEGKSEEFAILECRSSSHARRVPAGGWLAGTNHACELDEPGDHAGSKSRQARIEELVTSLRGLEPRLPRDLIAILADDAVERRGNRFATVYAAVACPGTGQLWFTFGGTPAASRGRWLPLAWPWP